MVIVKTVAITEFKAHCLQLVDEVARTGEEIFITKRGKVQALISRPRHIPDDYAPGKNKHTAWIIGDITAPIDLEWDAMK